MPTLAKSVHSSFIPANQTQVAGTATKIGILNKYRAAESATLLHERNEKFDGTSRLVIARPGHGAYSSQFDQNSGPGLAPMALARTGRYIVLSIDGGPNRTEWGNQEAMNSWDDALTWLRAFNAGYAGKYAALGWSMGGLATVLRARFDAANVAGAWVWVPALDLDYFAQTPGYNGPGNTGVTGSTVYPPEVAAAYPAGFAGRSPVANPGAWTNINVPIRFALTTDDPTVPPAHADYFLAQANNPLFTLPPGGKTLGGHTSMFGYYDDKQIVDYFDSMEW